MITSNQQKFNDTGNTLLETLKEHNAAPESHCESGFCGQCKMKLLKGNVSYIEEPLGFVKQGEILPCVCKSVGDIEVAFIL